MLELVTHGGKCCGIKTIRSFPEKPSQILDGFSATEANKNRDVQLMYSHIGQSFYPHARPNEKASERFDAYVEYVREMRPSHLIECVLNQYQLPQWKDFLKSRGFHLVSLHHNSNTHGTGIYTFHKIIKKGADVSAKDARKALKQALKGF